MLGAMALLSPLLLDVSVRCILALLPNNRNETAQSIIVLGRGPDSQSDRALTVSQLWSQNKQAEIFVSGMTDAPPIIENLKVMGVPEGQIRGERCSQSTWENGLFSDILLDDQTHKNVLLVTDSPHMLRAFLVFQGLGFDVTPYAVQVEPDNLFSLKRSQIILREYAAAVSYGVSGKFRGKSENEQQKDRVEAQSKIMKWNCYLDSN